MAERLEQYESELHGQRVTITVVPPSSARGVSRNYAKSQSDKRGDKYTPHREKQKYERREKIHPLIQKEE